ncbi:NAD(P)/FAD-dependent oxidoreductase [Roseovarius sp. S4756]|uniref:NAD(P)/FAD-dependent oxidoreductase n=1 Tax=Roseovarius maritimus TaxID=3342637 RepID=UPI00372ABC68
MTQHKTTASMLRGTPYWMEDTVYPPTSEHLSGSADLLIIGAGYTGLSAAIEARRLGLSVTVVDRELMGAGCSSRNGGQVSDGMKPSLGKLSRRLGAEIADRIYRDAYDAVEYLRGLVCDPDLDVGYQPSGRFQGAHSEKQFRLLSEFVERSAAQSPYRYSVIQRRDQRSEIGSDRYFGGIVNHDLFAVHPGKLHAALLSRALRGGVTVVEQADALSIEKRSVGFSTKTSKGSVASRHVLVATNGYTSPVFPWGRRRIIPIGTYMLATRELTPEQQTTLMPNGRNIVDSRKVVVYYRYSPDRKRLLFGGRAALSEVSPQACLPQLHGMMTDIFPQLEGIGVTHNWYGKVGYTFDHMAHIGCREGIHFALGYCGSGIATSAYYGNRIARQVAGVNEPAPAIYNLPFKTAPLYRGTPWFLAPSIIYYQMIDTYFS